MEYSIESLIAESTGLKSITDDRFVSSEENLYDGYADGIIQDTYRQLESVESALLLEKLSSNNDASKIRMLKRLKQVYGSTIDNQTALKGVESYFDKAFERSDEGLIDMLIKFLKWIKSIIEAILRAIKNFITGLISVFTNRFKDKSRNREYSKEDALNIIADIKTRVFKIDANSALRLWTTNPSKIESANKDLIKAVDGVNKMSKRYNDLISRQKHEDMDTIKSNNTRASGYSEIEYKILKNISLGLSESVKSDCANFATKYFKQSLFEANVFNFNQLIKNFSADAVKTCNNAVKKSMEQIDSLMKSMKSCIDSLEKNLAINNEKIYVKQINRDSIKEGLRSIGDKEESTKSLKESLKLSVECCNCVTRAMVDFTQKNIAICSVIDRFSKNERIEKVIPGSEKAISRTNSDWGSNKGSSKLTNPNNYYQKYKAGVYKKDGRPDYYKMANDPVYKQIWDEKLEKLPM